jgi:lysozyme family protein
MTWEGFKQAYGKTMRHEGGYADDPDDAGAETYMGISRRYNPQWYGWEIIELHKNTSRFPNKLHTITILTQQVKKFYKEKYWDTWRGDEFPDQALANEMFDTCVNLGVMRTCMFLQKALNVLNRGQILYSNLVVDGRVGMKTLWALGALKNKEKDDIKYVIKIINILQGTHYLKYMQQSPIQEKYARGWLNRVTIEK